MKRLYALILLIILIGLGFWFWHRHQQHTPAAPKPTLVSVVTASLKTIPLTVKAVGQIIAPETIMIKTQTAGVVTHIYFKSGQAVTKGQLLLQLDPTTAAAQVAQQYANYINLKTQYGRYKKLASLDKSAISADMLSQKKDGMQAAKAQWEAAKQQLSFTEIRAPFTGIIGIPEQISSPVAITSAPLNEAVQLNVGSYLPAGSPVAILSNPQHVFVQYQIPQTYSSKLSIGELVKLKIIAFPKQIFTGKVTYISPVVYESNQAYTIVASIDNPTALLRSGMSVSITQVIDPNQRILAIPGLTLVASLTGYSVYTIENSKVKEVPVTIGQRVDDLVAVESGLKVGDQVISSGALIVHPGMSVRIR